MGSKDISLFVLNLVVADLGSEFFTKDVSKDSRMTKAHFDLADHSHYHAFVGKALSENQAELGIRKNGYHHKRGSIWNKSIS